MPPFLHGLPQVLCGVVLEIRQQVNSYPREGTVGVPEVYGRDHIAEVKPEGPTISIRPEGGEAPDRPVPEKRWPARSQHNDHHRSEPAR